jgi:hypothetical protein
MFEERKNAILLGISKVQESENTTTKDSKGTKTEVPPK